MTAHLEEDMENIANGKAFLAEVVRESQDMLSDVIDTLTKHREQVGQEIRDALMAQSYIGVCPACKGELRVRRSRKGEFISCSNYPDCKQAYPKPKGAKVEATEQVCEVCATPKVKVIRRGVPPATICLNPDCESNKHLSDMGVCPECGANLRLLYSRAGKRFLGCTAYPACKRTYPLPQYGEIRPTGEKCEYCSAPLMVTSHRGRPWRFCVNIECPRKAKNGAKKKAEGNDEKKSVKKKPKTTKKKKPTSTSKKTAKTAAKKPAKKAAKKAKPA
jgi:DNA topoisomerase-1